MRRLTRWIIGGLVTMALWVPGVGAQDSRQMYQGMRRDWRDIRQDHRETLHRDRTDLRTDRHNVWREIHQDRQNIRREGLVTFDSLRAPFL